MTKYILFFMLIYQIGLAETWEMKHIINDIDIMAEDNWENTKCLDGTYNHLFINLPEKEWKKIVNSQIKEERAYFQADFCVKCRLISTRCSGNDVFRYQLKSTK